MAINSHLSPKYTNSAPPEQTNQPTDQSRSRRRNISRNLFPDGDLPETELIGGLAGRVKSLGDVESLPAAKRQKINKPKSKNTPPYLNEKKFEANSSDSPFPISFPALLTSPAVFSSQPPSVSLAPGAGTRYPQPLPPTPPRPSSSVSAYSILYNEAMQGTFTVNESSVNLTLLGNGTFMKVFSIASSAQLVDNLSNTELILKLYHGERTKFIPKKLDRYLENSLANYKAVQELNVPVSKIHNYDAAVETYFYP